MWLRDEFELQGEALTTALTASNVFRRPPGVLGSMWGPNWKPQADCFGFRKSWTHSVLVTLRDSDHPIMNDIWCTIKTTALRYRVVVMIQDVAKDTNPHAYTSKGARLLATQPQSTTRSQTRAMWMNS